jgi:hypothetical protein
MAGRIADGEEYELLLFSGPLQGFLSPGMPVNGIVCVLPEIGAFFVDEVVGWLGHGYLNFASSIVYHVR